MKFKKQNQHGAWAMVFMPLIIGMVAGGFHLSQLFYMAGWLMIFFMADHILHFIKRFKRKEYGYLKAAALFFAAAALLFVYPLITEYQIIFFFMAMIPFGMVNARYAYIKKERALVNDVAAIIIFSIAGGGIAFLNLHTFTSGIFFTMLISLLFFISTALFVKTMIREKKNRIFKIISFSYHTALFILMMWWHWFLAIAFIFSLIRAVLLYGRGWKMKRIGILEIIHAIWVTCWAIIYLVYVI